MIDLKLYKTLSFPTGELSLQVETSIAQGSFTVLYGSSGSGKTSTLRMLAGLLKPDQGSIIINGEQWYDSSSGVNLKPQLRKLGFVFQDYALFPNMSVRENLNYALKRKNDKAWLDELIDLVELGDFQDQKASSLSGGQQQRVAFIRALVQRPSILLLDEPLAALDDEMRKKIQAYLQKVHREKQLTILMVSHDVSEILKMADRVLVLDKGRLVKEGTAIDVFGQLHSEEGFRLRGELLALNEKGSDYLLRILVGKELMELSIAREQANELEIGDQIELSSEVFKPKLRKLN